MDRVRLHKYLARCGLASRRKAENLILAGAITVNGVQADKLGTVINADVDLICVNGKRVVPPRARLFLFHKPPQVITSMKDPQGRKTVADFFGNLGGRFFPVGRLDFDVVGLLLVTNDGDLAHRLLHPRFMTARRYLALVEELPNPETLARLKYGVRLGEKVCRASEASVRRRDSAADRLFKPSSVRKAGGVVELVVHEGEKHFVKRLLARVGHPVLALARVQFGPYKLGDLKPGMLREVAPP